MDELNRGISNYYDGHLQINLHDDYEHIDSSVEYVVENVLQTSDTSSSEYAMLQEKFHTFAAQTCDCTEPNRCMDGNDCLHGGNYVVYEDKQTNHCELILNENRKSRDLIYECSAFCSCASYCSNRLVQFGPRKGLKIEDYSHLGKHLGLTTLVSIPKGSFVCEYAGEILCAEEAHNRHQLNDANKHMNYIICLNERPIGGEALSCTFQTFIDPSRIGNIGRYLNHSCDPNCEIISVRIDSVIPKLGMTFDTFDLI